MDHQWIVTERQRCDLELLMTGAMAPLTGFMNREDYLSVLQDMSLQSGELWPIPVTLDIPQDLASQLSPGMDLMLARGDGTPLAALHVSDVYPVDFDLEARLVYGTTNPRHMGVRLLHERHPFYVGGQIRVLDRDRQAVAERVDFLPPYRTPVELKALWSTINKPVIAFQTRNPMHGAHQALTLAAIQQTGGHLLLHPVVGPTQPGDVEASLRIRAILALAQTYPLSDRGEPQVTVATLPLAMRMAGPREALWHGLIRQNYGANYFIVGRAPADPGGNPDREDGFWWPPFEAQELFQRQASRLRIKPLAFPEYAWHPAQERYLAVTPQTPEKEFLRLSGSRVRQTLRNGHPLPAWYAPETVRTLLEEAHNTRWSKGLVLFFTGLSAAGKSTIANAVSNALKIRDARPVTLLDGDVIRRHLSRGLGFSRADRLENMERVAFVASVIAQHGGIAIVSMIAPYEDGRKHFRQTVEEDGRFVEIYVSTSLEECERRDPKGLYAKARRGEVAHMTGIDEPYEIPSNPDFNANTQGRPLATVIDDVLGYLEHEDIIAPMHLASITAPLMTRT